MDLPVQGTVSPTVSVTKSSHSLKTSQKFSSLRGIIRIPIKRTRGASISNDPSNATNTNTTNTHSHSLSHPPRHNHHQHSRAQSNDYTPPQSVFGNSPYGPHTRSPPMKPYMSQPMLGLGHTRETDGDHSVGDGDSSSSTSPERSPVRREAALSAANLHRVAPWTAASPSNTPHRNNAYAHAQKHPTTVRAAQPAAGLNGASSATNTAPKLGHTRKLSAQSISNAIANTTHAGLAVLGVKTRRMSVDETSRPQTQPMTNPAKTGRGIDSKASVKGTHSRNHSLANEAESAPPKPSALPSTSVPRRKAPLKPLPPEPIEPVTPIPTKTLSTAPESKTTLPPSTNTQSLSHPRPPNNPSVPPLHMPAPSNPPSIDMQGSNNAQIAEDKPELYASMHTMAQITPAPLLMNPNFVFPPIQNYNRSHSPHPLPRPISRPPSGALAPAASSLTTSRNDPTTSLSNFTSRPSLQPVKRSMTAGDESLRLSLPSSNNRLTLHEVLESNSARLSPSVILRPPPLPLINLPMLSTPTIRMSAGAGSSAGDGSAQLQGSRSHANGRSASRRAIKSMPALPLQGTSRGTRGHEEVDDMEDDDEDDDIDEEDEEETEDMHIDLHSASSGRMSVDSEMSTDDDGSSDLDLLPTDDNAVGSSSMAYNRQRTISRMTSHSSYQTAHGGDEDDVEISPVEPSPALSEPYYGNPQRQPDKRFSRAPHLPRVETSGLEFDFSFWDQKRTPKDLNSTRGQEQQPASSGVDKGKARAREGAVGLFSEGEMGAFFTPEDVLQTPIGGSEAASQNHGGHGIGGALSAGTATNAHPSVGLRDSEYVDGRNRRAEMVGGVENDVTESRSVAAGTAVGGTSASPSRPISATPGNGVGMDYFFYRSVPHPHPPLGPRRDSSRSEKATMSSATNLSDMTPTISTTTTMTTIMNPSRGTSPLRTPRPRDFMLNVNATTPMSPALSGLPPSVPPKVSEARLSVTLGTLSPHAGLYKIASRSLIDVHGMETKERVEKMMKDEEDAAEREHKARKRNGKGKNAHMRATDSISPALEKHDEREGDATVLPTQSGTRTPPHSADPVMAGAAKRSSTLLSALSVDPSFTEPPKDEQTRNRRISAAPAYDDLPHPLRRRRSMPTFNASTAPPPYPDFSPQLYGLKKNLIIQPREDEGAEKLPPYSNGIYLRAVMPRKMEFSQPGQQAKDRKWRKVLCVLEGTAFKVYKCPAATGVSVIGEWWENKVGAGDFSEPMNHAYAAGGTSGFRITTETSRGEPAELTTDVPGRKSGEGGQTGAPVLQRNNSSQAPQPSPPPPHPLHPLGHHSNHSVAYASTRSALNLAVQLLKPTPRHGRSNSDVPMSPSQPRSPRASLNLSRSGRTTPTTSPHGSSLRSRSPTASTHLTTPSSSAGLSSRPTTPSSSVSPGLVSGSASSSRSGFRSSPSANRSQQAFTSSSTPPSSFKGKGKEKNEAPEPHQSDLIRSYTMQNAESGLGKDYIKRQHVLRVRLEGEQFLLQANNVESVIAWIEGLQSAANVALDLDERPMPAGPIFPRRRRRRRPAATTTSSSAPGTNMTTPSPTIPNGPLASVRPLERSAGRR